MRTIRNGTLSAYASDAYGLLVHDPERVVSINETDDGIVLTIPRGHVFEAWEFADGELYASMRYDGAYHEEHEPYEDLTSLAERFSDMIEKMPHAFEALTKYLP